MFFQDFLLSEINLLHGQIISLVLSNFLLKFSFFFSYNSAAHICSVNLHFHSVRMFLFYAHVSYVTISQLKSDHSVFSSSLEITQSSQKQLLMLHVCSISVWIVIKMQ